MTSATIAALLGFILHGSAAPAPESRQGDWVITGNERIVGKHIRLEGNLVLAKGARLELEDCTLEVIGTKSREHLLDWKGGTLITRRCTLGGFVQNDGTPIHTVFHLHDGVWEATDTTVQYSYGISFGHDTGGRLTATRLKAGPRPDAIIASGTADISLTECEFPIAVSIYAHAGGKAHLDLPVTTPVNRVFDASNTPGIRYRMELRRTVVPDHWFLFLRNIGNSTPRCEVTLGDCPKLIVSLLGHNVTDELRLSTDLATPVKYGNVRLSRVRKPVNIFLWALYASGDQTDVTVRGPARICELMHRGGQNQASRHTREERPHPRLHDTGTQQRCAHGFGERPPWNHVRRRRGDWRSQCRRQCPPHGAQRKHQPSRLPHARTGLGDTRCRGQTRRNHRACRRRTGGHTRKRCPVPNSPMNALGDFARPEPTPARQSDG